MAFKKTGLRKQVVLYLLAVILPSTVLVAVTYRMIRQEQELAQKIATEECSRVAKNIGKALLRRLEDMKLQERTALAREKRPPSSLEYINRDIILLAEVKDTRLVLPWDHDPRIGEAEKALSQAPFASWMRRGEEEEFRQKNFASAATYYRRNLAGGETPFQKGFAAIPLARVLSKAGRLEEASSQYKSILDLSPALVDENGIPLCLYAARPLIKISDASGVVSQKLTGLLDGKNWISPDAVHFIQNIVEDMTALKMEYRLRAQVELLQEKLHKHKRFLEEVSILQQRFPGLGLMNDSPRIPQADSPVWLSFSPEHWLVSTDPKTLEYTALCIVVDGRTTLEAVKQEFSNNRGSVGEFEWITDELNKGESLGPNFRGLGFMFSPTYIASLIKQRSPQKTLYALLLLLVLSMTLFGGYLLWRDVRRELRLAEMRSQFVSSVSHELKTPLTAIRMFAETMRLGRSKDPKMQEDYLDTIVNESQRLTRLLNNVLDFSKVEQGKRHYHMQPASLAEVLQSAVRTMSYPLSQQGFQLHVQIEPDVPEVQIDRDALEQAVLNLLSNAMKYSGESRVIDLKLSKSDNSALIQVVDQGIGIPPEEQKRIFDKYYRVLSDDGEQSSGTGLGLALVSHIVASHGGRIEVESMPGRGSTFSIQLPLGDLS